jgi:hypothetical protein
LLIFDDPFDDDGVFEVDTNQDNEPDDGLTDVHDKVYANVPEETHMLAPVANCEFCHAGTSLKHLDFAAVVVKSFSPLLTRLWNWLCCGLALILYFRFNVRFFNGPFSFTSLTVIWTVEPPIRGTMGYTLSELMVKYSRKFPILHYYNNYFFLYP